MSSLAVLVPVLRRPHRIPPFVAAFEESVAADREAGWACDLLVVCSSGDRAEVAAVQKAGLKPLVVNWLPVRGDYARKINLAARRSDADWLFTGADDLHFHSGWLSAALEVHVETGALVIGTNDLCNPVVIRGDAATHSLVHRSWLEHAVADAPGQLLCELYDHNCVDVELVETARAAGVFAVASGSHVEHLHWTKGRASRDSTYRKGFRKAALDRKLLAQRRRLWQQPAVAR